MIDWTLAIPASAQAARDSAAARAAAGRARILAAVPEPVQAGLVAHAAAGLMTPAERAAYRDLLRWMRATREAADAAAADWPDLPPRAAALLPRF
jgi:hypothetical protein